LEGYFYILTMKVLITGDTGLLGANLCFLWRNKYDVVGVSRMNKSVCGIRHISQDLLKFEEIECLIQTEMPDVIVHTAAMVSVDECEKQPNTAESFNADMVEYVMKAAKKNGIYLIHISTDSFYQGNGNELCLENSPLVLKSKYAETKRKGEINALEYSNTLCLRTNIFGCNFKNKFSFSEWILYELKAGNEITMFTDVLFSPILVNDLAYIIELAISNHLTGLYNVGGTGSISKYDFGVYLKEQLGITTGNIKPISVKDFSFAAWRSHNMSMDSSKIQHKLSVEIPTIKQSIANYLSLLKTDYPKQLKEEQI